MVNVKELNLFLFRTYDIFPYITYTRVTSITKDGYYCAGYDRVFSFTDTSTIGVLSEDNGKLFITRIDELVREREAVLKGLKAEVTKLIQDFFHKGKS